MCSQRILRGDPPPSISLLGPHTGAENNGLVLYPPVLGGGRGGGRVQRMRKGTIPEPTHQGGLSCHTIGSPRSQGRLFQL